MPSIELYKNGVDEEIYNEKKSGRLDFDRGLGLQAYQAWAKYPISGTFGVSFIFLSALPCLCFGIFAVSAFVVISGIASMIALSILAVILSVAGGLLLTLLAVNLCIATTVTLIVMSILVALQAGGNVRTHGLWDGLETTLRDASASVRRSRRGVS